MSHGTAQDAYLRYRTGLSICLLVVIVQTLVLFFTALGNSSNWSIGLFEDTMHGIADNLVLIGATIILYFEAEGAAPNKGRKRVLALVGGILLIGAALGGAFVAHDRIVGRQLPLSGWVLAITSLVAMIGGWFAFRVIHGVHKDAHDHLHKSAVGHLIGDLAISVAVFISSIGIIYFNFPAIDSFVALFLISPWMLHRGIQILRYKDPPQGSHDAHHGHSHT